MTSPLSTVTESQDRLLEQKKKFTRKKLRDRLLRNSRKLDNLEGEIISQSRDLLKDLDNKVRDRITSFADASRVEISISPSTNPLIAFSRRGTN